MGSGIGLTETPQGGRPDSVLGDLIDAAARSRMAVRDVGGTPALEARLPGPFRAVFTTRRGGESTGAFSRLNLSPYSGDDPDAVQRNRDRVAYVCGRRLVRPAQEHGLGVVGAAEYLEEGAGSPCDGLTIHCEIDKGLGALLLFADCLPVVLCGEMDMAIAHCGWRGLLGGIVQQAGRALMGMPGMAVIGPSIGPCCFTVAHEVAHGFAGRFGSEVVIPPGLVGESPRVDLWAAAARALHEVGISPTQIVNPRICTACNTDFFYSHRLEGPVTGRHGCLGWVATP